MRRGWALQGPTTRSRNKEVTQAVESYFFERKKQGLRACPYHMAEVLENARKPNGMYRYPVKDLRSPVQLAAKFGQLDRKKRTASSRSSVSSLKRGIEEVGEESEDESVEDDYDVDEMMRDVIADL